MLLKYIYFCFIDIQICLLEENIYILRKKIVAWLIIFLLPGVRSEVQWLVWCITAAISSILCILWFRRRTGDVASIPRIHMGPLSFSPSWVCMWVVIRRLVGGSVLVISVARLVLMAWHMPALPSGLHHTKQCRINLKKKRKTKVKDKNQSTKTKVSY